MNIEPHTSTHGSARARQSWFTRGFESGDPEQCDTYAVSSDEVGL
jgi:predicted metalloprotease